MSNQSSGRNYTNQVAKAYGQSASHPIPRMTENEQIVAQVTQQRRDKDQIATLDAYKKVTEAKAI